MRKLAGLMLMLVLPTVAPAQTTVEVQEVKELTPDGSLGTCGYSPVPSEQSFYSRLAAKDRSTGSVFAGPEFRLKGKRKKFVSWFGIVRGVKSDGQAPGAVQLLLEHKYFDGLTDCHLMLVSSTGAGDFVATVKADAARIPPLSLVRIYGIVSEEVKGVPRIDAEYVRVWPWLTFAFSDLGPEDHGNPRWSKYCKTCKGGRIYRPYPTERYYRDMLGDPNEFGAAVQDW